MLSLILKQFCKVEKEVQNSWVTCPRTHSSPAAVDSEQSFLSCLRLGLLLLLQLRSASSLSRPFQPLKPGSSTISREAFWDCAPSCQYPRVSVSQ